MRGHREALARLGLPRGQAAALGAYLDLLEAWAHRVNLTGARSPEERVDLLVAPALFLLPLLEPGPLLDVGSGNGSPGLVLALLAPQHPVTLLEPRVRRWAFLREAARAAGRADIKVLRLRHDGYRGAPAQTVTLRALRLPLKELAPLVRDGGRVLVLGRHPEPDGPFRREEAPAAAGLPLAVFRRGSGRTASGP